ncbi:MAG: hypothetical protein C4534_01965 [Gaiellales bacterium]|nr:MAG: hypothetical protein C4534_01965 [Gaiellales bacterium]
MERLILETKLRPPDCERMFERERLFRSADSNGGMRLLSVDADAGYGKTVLLAQLQQRVTEPCVWYRLDKSDRDVNFLLLHLIRGVSNQAPDFDSWVEGFFRGGRASEIEPSALLESFLAEFEQRVSRPFSFFLDDFHLIETSAAAVDAVRAMIGKMPAGVSFYVAGRTRPPLGLSRLRTVGEVREISADELRFTQDEVNDYFSGELPDGIGFGEFERLVEGARGWPAALALIRNQVQRDKRTGRSDLTLAVFRDINEYLAEEVWAHLDEELKDMLMNNSLVEVIDPDVWDQAGSGPEGTEVLRLLDEAAQRNILVQRDGFGNQYRIHPLFRGFLVERLKASIGIVGIRERHRGYAEHFSRKGMPEAAVHHLIEAGMHDELAAVVEEIGSKVLESGRVRTLAYWLGHIPDRILEQRPWLCYFKSRVLDPDKEQAAADRLLALAGAGFEKAGDRRGMYLNAYAVNSSRLYTNRHEEAIGAAIEMVELADDPGEKVFALNRLALSNMLVGRPHEAMNLWGEARELCDEGDDSCRRQIDTSMVSAKFYLGDYDGILKLSGGLLQRLGHVTPVLSRFVVLGFRAVALIESMQYEEAASLLGRFGEMLGAEYREGERYVEALQARVMLYRDQSREGRRKIREIVDDCDNLFLLGPENPLVFIGNYERHLGNHDKALAYHREALELCSENAFYPAASCLVNIGADRMRLGEAGSMAGEDELAAAEALALRTRANFILAQVSFHRAWRAFAQGDETLALREAGRTLSEAARYRYDHFIAREGRISLGLLAFAYAHGIERDYLTGIFRQIGSRSLSALAPMLHSEDMGTRKDVIMTMAAAGGLSAVPRVQRMLGDGSPAVRAAARRAINVVREGCARPEDILSRRELEVLEMIAEGASNLEIAARMVVTESTVKSHVSSIFRKLSVSSRVQAAMYFNQRVPQAGEAEG